MTTIAVKDGIMAGDKQATSVSLKIKVTKIFRIRDEIIGVAGDYDAAMKFVKEYKRDENLLEEKDDTKADFEYLKIIKKDKKIYHGNGYGTPWVMEQTFASIGTGRKCAYAAMHCGKSSKEAVKISGVYDNNTGPIVQELKF